MKEDEALAILATIEHLIAPLRAHFHGPPTEACTHPEEKRRPLTFGGAVWLCLDCQHAFNRDGEDLGEQPLEE